jgi:hypothetical protein
MRDLESENLKNNTTEPENENENESESRGTKFCCYRVVCKMGEEMHKYFEPQP